MVTSRIKVPADAVRSAEAILESATVIAGHVWVTCWNCHGTGNYPSSMIPPGKCRLYCWALTDGISYRSKMGTEHAPTYGRLAVPVEKYVKQEQAADRRAYRANIRYEMDRPEREAREARITAERIEREREQQARRDAVLAEKAKRRHIGTVGERLTLTVTVEAVRRFESGDWRNPTRYLVKFRDSDQNALTWWTSTAPALTIQEGAAVEITATVKAHGSYGDEPQTALLRVRVEPALALAEAP